MATINTINTATDTPASAATITNDNFTSLETDVDLNTAKTSYTDSAAVALNTAKVSADGSIDDHSDVDTTTTAPVNNDTLSFNSSTEKWEPRTAETGTQTILFPVQYNSAGATLNPYTSVVGAYGTVQLQSSQACYTNMYFPANMDTITSVKVLMIPDATETIQADFLMYNGADGETYTAHSNSAPNETLAVTQDKLTSWDITSLGTDIFADVEAGEHGALRIYSDINSLRITGVLLTYTV